MEGVDGPGEEGRRRRGAEDEDSALDIQTVIQAWPHVSRWRGWDLTWHQGPSLWSCHQYFRLLLVPGFVPCPEGIPPWGAKPVPQDSGSQPSIQKITTGGSLWTQLERESCWT